MAILTSLLLTSLLVQTVRSVSAPLLKTGWTATADSFNVGNEPSNAIDDNMDTFWHSQYNPSVDALPNWLIIDMKSTYYVHAVTYLPRQDGQSNGRIGGHRIDVSTDAASWTMVATGTYFNDDIVKTTSFVARAARYVRITATTEAQGMGRQWTSIAEVNVFREVTYDYASRSGWTVSADSEETTRENSPASKAIDGDLNTLWHTRYNGGAAPLPHWFQIDAGAQISVAGLSYTPRVSPGNGRIGDFSIETSNDGTTWTEAVTGTWPDDDTEKISRFDATARYFRLNAFSEAGGRGQWTSAREINLVSGLTAVVPPTPPPNKGLWVNTVDFPLVPAAVAMLPNGRVLAWSAFARDEFGGANGFTQTAIYDPVTGESTQRTVANTQHDMFCPGISMDFDGRIVITGGSNAAKTSIYDGASDSWIAGANMQIARGYQSTTTCSDGRIFNIGGSWSGGDTIPKNGEIYNPGTNTWSLLQNALVSPMLTADREGQYRSDNHGWLFGWSNRTVFQAGPSKAMNWYDTIGAGSVTGAGNRADDGDAMCGNAVMYDASNGKILTAGGSAHYETDVARPNAYVITIGTPKTNPQVTRVPNMAFARGFANGVALPDGTVFVTGGQSFQQPFTDTTAQLIPELFDPATNTWTQMNPMAIPRTYHSVAILLQDATVLQGGGGLCGGCGVNHFDAEIFVPPYLLNTDGSRRTRPVINSVAATARLGATLSITTNSAVARFSLIRFGSATHSANTDQRRIPLTPTGSGTSYTVTIPSDPGVALPGNWFLFAINSAGTPSVARIVRVTP